MRRRSEYLGGSMGLEGEFEKKVEITGKISREKRSCGEEVGSEEEIGISRRGNFSSFLSLFGKGEVGRRKKDVLQQNSI